MALLGILGCFYTFTSCFGIQFQSAPVLVCAILFTLLFSVIYSFRCLLKLTLPAITVLYCASVLIFWQDLYFGMTEIGNQVIDCINANSAFDFWYFISPAQGGAAYAPMLFLIVLLFLVTAVVTYGVVYRTSFLLVACATVPFAGAAFYFLLVPHNGAFAMLLACWTAVLAMQISSSHIRAGKKKKADQTQYNHEFVAVGKKAKFISHNSRSRQSVLGTVGCVLVCVTMLSFLAGNSLLEATGFQRPEGLKAFSGQLNQMIKGSVLSSNKKASMGISGGKLGDVDQLSYQGETALKVKIPQYNQGSSEAIYLKGFVGSDYKGNSWGDFEDSVYNREYSSLFLNYSAGAFHPQNLNSLYWDAYLKVIAPTIENGWDAKSIEEYLLATEITNPIPVQITNVNANPKFVYAPYNSAYPTDLGFIYHYDNSVNPNKLNEYTFHVYINEAFSAISDNTDLLWPMQNRRLVAENNQELTNREKTYRDFVYDVYTRLPEKGLDRIKQEFSKDSSINSGDLFDTLKQVKQRLWSQTSYSMAPGRLPKGKDFVENFLYENQQGYCTHYATAATVILRSLGIPTRYVEGYVITSSDFEQQAEYGQLGRMNQILDLEIKDKNAHAWVEVYLDGHGWYPYEVTPGYSGFRAGFQEKPDPSKNQSQQNSASASEENNPPKTNDTSSAKSLLPQNPEQQQQRFLGERLLIVATALLLLVALFWTGILVRRQILIKRRMRSTQTEDQSNHIRELYRYLYQVLLFDHMGNDANLPYLEYAVQLEQHYPFIATGECVRIMEFVLKANFSEAQASRIEAKQVDAFVEKAVNNIYAELSRKEQFKFRYLHCFN